MKTELVDYRELPGHNPLFLDFLYDFDKVSDLFAGPASLDELRKRASAIVGSGKAYPRRQLASILESFNRGVGCGEKTLANIEKLRQPDSVAIVTGQQLSLFGGPGFSFYKAATALRLAERLESEGIPTIAVFWLPSDDSDFDEIRSTSWMDRHGRLFDIRYGSGQPNGDRMAGTMPLTSVEEHLDQLSQREIGGSLFQDSLDLLRACYRPDSDFRHAFARWLSELFKDRGLVLFDALSTGYKPLVSDVFRTAIERRQEIVEALGSRGALLEERGYRAQVHSDDRGTLFFRMQEGSSRRKVEYSDGSFRTKNDPNSGLSRRELIEALQRDPESFGPNVLLRPIVQDRLFPALTYVGGAAEVAYFSQIGAIAALWDIEPHVTPRAGVTIVDRKAQRFLKQHDLTPTSIIGSDRLAVIRGILESGDSSSVIGGFRKLEEDVRRHLEALEGHIRSEDPPVADMLKGAGERVLHQIDKVENRYVRNHEDRNAAVGRHLDYLYSHLFPRSKMQERVLNFNWFLAQEGRALYEDLLSNIDPLCRKHQIFLV